MRNLILTIVLKMFMAFVSQTVLEDTEVVLMDESSYEMYGEMDYDEILTKEWYLDKYEEQSVSLYGYEYENEQIFYVLYYDCNDFEFDIVISESGELVGYGMYLYD